MVDKWLTTGLVHDWFMVDSWQLLVVMIALCLVAMIASWLLSMAVVKLLLVAAMVSRCMQSAGLLVTARGFKQHEPMNPLIFLGVVIEAMQLA